MARLSLQEAYPKISIRPRSRRLWARFMQWPAECIHMENAPHWMATYIPDMLYLRGKARARREPRRPEISVCFDCLSGLLEPELAATPARVIAFEPDGESFTQYFFLGREDFTDAGLQSEVSAAIETRLENMEGSCSDCGAPATWLWISRREVSSLDQADRIETSPGALFCAKHGAAKLCAALGQIEQANLFYVNAPYGESGAYVWI
jgi:hypothetical protein